MQCAVCSEDKVVCSVQCAVCSEDKVVPKNLWNEAEGSN